MAAGLHLARTTRTPELQEHAMATTPPLITAAQAGDQAALAELYQQYQPEVHRYIASRVRDRDLADDLTQDVFVRALRGLSGYRWTGRDFGAWLVTIARNLITDHHRSGQHRLEVPLEDLALGQEAGPLLEDQVLAELDAEPVRAAVATLPATWREALVLTHWAGASNAQISASTGRSPGAVRTLKCRATTALRRQLTAA